MHRSGTSWRPEACSHLGLELGDVNTQAKHNAKGNRENDEYRLLHEKVLLNCNGGVLASSDAAEQERSRSLSRRKHEPSHRRDESGRTNSGGSRTRASLLVLDEWHRQVDHFIRVGIYRHPLVRLPLAH